MKNNYYTWAKFICPLCGKKFKAKINENLDVITLESGEKFECHVHCPKCECYIPYRLRERK